MNYRFRVFAMLVAVVGFGFVAASASAQLSITEVSSNNSLGEDWFEITNTSQWLNSCLGWILLG